ncbi:MAG: YesL family protein [Clostridiaceae bacterium]
MKIFNYQGGFYAFGTKLFELIVLNFVFLATTILGIGITTGASLTALLYSINKTIRKEEGYVLKNYFKSFKENFKQSTILWVILSIGYYIVYINLEKLDLYGKTATVVNVVVYVFLVELIFITIYSFPLIAKVNIGNKEAIKKSILLSHKHLLTSLTCASVVVVSYLLVTKVHAIFILIAFSLPGYFIMRLVYENILMKYIPKEALEEAGEINRDK